MEPCVLKLGSSKMKANKKTANLVATVIAVAVAALSEYKSWDIENIMLSAAVIYGYLAGYNTLNPNLRKDEE